MKPGQLVRVDIGCERNGEDRERWGLEYSNDTDWYERKGDES